MTKLEEYLASVDAPSVIDPAAAVSAIAAFADARGRIEEQASLWARQLQACELAMQASPEQGGRQVCGEVATKLGAIRRLAADAERTSRQLADALRGLGEANARLRREGSGAG